MQYHYITLVNGLFQNESPYTFCIHTYTYRNEHRAIRWWRIKIVLPLNLEGEAELKGYQTNKKETPLKDFYRTVVGMKTKKWTSRMIQAKN